MPNIPTFSTPGGTTFSGAAQPTADAGAFVQPYIAQAQSGQQLANLGDRFAQKYIDAKMQVAAADQTADLSQQLQEVQFRTSKIPDREKAAAAYDAETQKLYDNWSSQSSNPILRAHVESRFAQERVLRRADTLNAAFGLESQTQRGKLIEQLDAYSKSAAGSNDPRLRDKLIQDGLSAIDGRVQGGWMNPEAGAKAKVDFQSGVYRAMIELEMAKNPRVGLAMYDMYKNKLNFTDGHIVGVMSEDKRVENTAEGLVDQRLPVLGTYGNASKWGGIIEGAAAKSGLPASLIGATASVESGGNEMAVSPAGARGPMQFMPGTAADEGVQNPHDPAEAIPKGAGYLKKQVDRFGSFEKGLVAYNWGPANAEKWVKEGADFSKLPKETQDYVREVMRREGVFAANSKSGDALATYRTEALKAEQELLADNTMDPRVKQRALAFLQQRSRTTEGLVLSQRKQLEDNAQTLAFGLFNGTYKDGGFAGVAQGYRDTGDQSQAAVYDFLAKNEGLLKDFASLPPNAQRTFAHILPGAAGKIAASILADQRIDRKEMREYAAQQHGLFQKGIQEGLDPTALAENVREAAMAYMAAGDQQKAKQIVDTYSGLVEGARKGSLPTGMAEEELRRLKEIAESSNGLDAKTSAAIGLLEKGIQKNRDTWANDPIVAAEKFTGRLDPYQPGMSGADLQVWANKRVQQAIMAQNMKDPRATVQSVSMFSQTEADALKSHLLKGSVQDRQVTLSTLATAIPNDQVPLVAAKIAGNDKMGDAWATAMAFYKRGLPGDRQIADSMIQGSNLWVEGGPEGREKIKLDPTTFSQVDSLLGTARSGMDGRDREMQNNAIAARYVALAGKKADSALDPTLLAQAVKEVVGTKATVNGADLILPTGVQGYQFRDGIASLQASDLPPLMPAGGQVITAEKVRQHGTYQSVGDGLYKVWMPDPQRGGLHEVVRSDTGKPWVVDIRPLVNRTEGARGIPAGVTGYERTVRERANAPTSVAP